MELLKELCSLQPMTTWLFEAAGPEKKQQYLANNMTTKIVDAAKADRSCPVKFEKGMDEKQFAFQVVQELTKADPSKGYNYLNFIVRIYTAKEFKCEDIYKIKESLSIFDKNKPRIENKDINSYKSIDDLYSVLEQFKDKEDHMTKGDIERNIKKGAETIIDTPNFKVIVPKTREAACIYGANTQWCTAAKDEVNNMFDTYHAQGPLFIIIARKNDKDKKFQLHYESGQFMNENDRALTASDISYLSSFPEYKEFLELLIDHHYYGVKGTKVAKHYD